MNSEPGFNNNYSEFKDPWSYANTNPDITSYEAATGDIYGNVDNKIYEQPEYTSQPEAERTNEQNRATGEKANEAELAAERNETAEKAKKVPGMVALASAAVGLALIGVIGTSVYKINNAKQEVSLDVNLDESTEAVAVDPLTEERREELAQYEITTGNAELDEMIKGHIFHGENLLGMWNDRVTKAEVMRETGRTVDNDFMTAKALYEKICVDPENPTEDEKRAVSCAGSLAMSEKAALVLKNGLELNEFKNMSAQEVSDYLKNLDPDSEDFDKYARMICAYHLDKEKSTLETKSIDEAIDEELAKIEGLTDEQKQFLRNYFQQHAYPNEQGIIEFRNLPTSGNAKVLVWHYNDEHNENVIRMELEACRNDCLITLKEDGKIIIRTGNEGTGNEGTGEERTGNEGTGNENTGIEITPKNEQAEIDNASNEWTSILDLNNDITPRTTEDQDRDMSGIREQEREDREQEEANAAEENSQNQAEEAASGNTGDRASSTAESEEDHDAADADAADDQAANNDIIQEQEDQAAEDQANQDEADEQAEQDEENGDDMSDNDEDRDAEDWDNGDFDLGATNTQNSGPNFQANQNQIGEDLWMSQFGTPPNSQPNQQPEQGQQ